MGVKSQSSSEIHQTWWEGAFLQVIKGYLMKFLIFLLYIIDRRKISFDGTEDASLPGQYSETIHLVLVSHKCKAHSRLHSQRIESLMLT